MKIVSPYPPARVSPDYQPPDGAAWWRFRLRPNTDGHTIVATTDSDPPTWISWELFDGTDAVIDVGLDRVMPTVLTETGAGGYVDVLCVGPPSSSSYWTRLRIPPIWPHPDFNPDAWWSTTA